MKLATYKDGSRDGQLIVVARDLGTAHYATGIATRLQQVLDDWNFISPQLQDLYDALNRSPDAAGKAGLARHAFAFDPQQCMAPLPRAYQRVEGSAYASLVEPMRHTPDQKTPAGMFAGLELTRCRSDAFPGPCDAVACAGEALDIDFCAGLAVVTGDLPVGVSAAQALDGIRLLMLASSVSVHQPMAQEVACAFSPVAITLDELSFSDGSAWDGGRVHLTLNSRWNGRKVGLCDAGADMTFHFGQLIAQLCQHHPVSAGSIIGSGPVSQNDPSRGYHCIAAKRALEFLQDGKPMTDFMSYGDTLRVEMQGRDGASLFGAIDLQIVPSESAGASSR